MEYKFKFSGILFPNIFGKKEIEAPPSNRAKIRKVRSR
jgi:hypothetical protein